MADRRITILPYTHHAWLLFHQMLYTSHSINRLPENIIEAKLVPIVNIINGPINING